MHPGIDTPVTVHAEQAPLAERVRSVLEGLRADDLDGVERLRPLYDEDMVFEDPIQKVRGLDAFVALNRRLLGRAKDLTFRVHDAATTGDVSFLTWTMLCTPKLGPKIHVDGTTHLRVRGGRVAYHRDYWDLGELFTSVVPGGHAALRLLLRPLA
jgi:limonene-1,2-epoxide hydrolase